MKNGQLILIFICIFIVLSGCNEKSNESNKGNTNSLIDKVETNQVEKEIREKTEIIEKSIEDKMISLNENMATQKAKMEPILNELQSKQSLVMDESSGFQDVYFGDLVNNKPDGFGSLRVYTSSKNVSSYVGQFTEGLPNGVSLTYFNDDSVYVGEVKNGNLIGQGIYVEALFDEENTKEYVGEFIQFDSGKYFAEYTEEPDAVTFQNGDFYKGGYTTLSNEYDYSFEGPGIFSKGFGDSNRFTYKGKFKNNRPVPQENGYAKVTLNNGDIYIGQVVNSIPNGLGAIISTKDDSYAGVYFGNVVNGKADGYGILDSYIGNFVDGKIHGIGYAFDGTVEIRGFFENDWDGVGVIKSTNDEFTGEFKNRSPYLGELLSDQLHYTGTFEEVNGKVSPHGFGMIKYSDKVYKGEIADSISNGLGVIELTNGEGVIEFSNGDKFVGIINFGLAYGNGYYTNNKGNEYLGLFNKGRPQDPVVGDSSKVVADYLILSETSHFMDVSVVQ
ncbi:hypothetical protein [Cohnella sp. WQ 127256]|uniref:hypothetical protein n=1 Tax=Cohnella sp. WQ 127256 TaxID=2938790 RepID=UPI0021176937|nr:hypothetical protein [Cohnella sp. WQ 127256]